MEQKPPGLCSPGPSFPAISAHCWVFPIYSDLKSNPMFQGVPAWCHSIPTCQVFTDHPELGDPSVQSSGDFINVCLPSQSLRGRRKGAVLIQVSLGTNTAPSTSSENGFLLFWWNWESAESTQGPFVHKSASVLHTATLCQTMEGWRIEKWPLQGNDSWRYYITSPILSWTGCPGATCLHLAVLEARRSWKITWTTVTVRCWHVKVPWIKIK